ncbi:MAG TPA: protein-glutamate O-methyltransferase [Alphaproteobacteria bacterium]|nr:protein-glutamate O-methyltransferase [Alphaproteobacteria bacterium]
MKPEDFTYFCKLILDRTGLVLGSDKTYLIESRLTPVARKHKLPGLDALATALRQGRDATLLRDFTDALMTNESFFFRDGKPFEQFRQVVLPRLMTSRAQQKHCRIWSAACSTGQEPYTLAMILKEEAAKLAGWKFEIVGTDISQEALNRARDGIYTQFEVQRGLPIQLLVKYFKQDGDKWQIASELRAMVQYREFNLLEELTSLGRFDVVFCRNVLIYFDQAAKSAILERISRALPADGLLYLGGAETVLGVSDRFEPLAGHRGIYAVAQTPVTSFPSSAPKLAANA